MNEVNDIISIDDLEVFSNHGVLPEENALGQKFIISAKLYTSTRNSGIYDDLSQTISYSDICHFISSFMKKHTYKLIETVAEQLAKELLLSTPGLKKIILQVKKPWAPIALPLKTVSVQIERSWHHAFLSLGSNMGNRLAYLNQAVSELSQSDSCQILQVSDFISTKPYGMTNQEDFLNGCLELKTLLTPQELLAFLNSIEKNANRERTIHWGPRTLDLDIIFYDDIIIDQENLTIPHIDMHNRSFVLKPLCQIAPYKRHPLFNKTVRQLTNDLKNREQTDS